MVDEYECGNERYCVISSIHEQHFSASYIYLCATHLSADLLARCRLHDMMDALRVCYDRYPFD